MSVGLLDVAGRAALAALAAAACVTREVEVIPFAISVVDETGMPLPIPAPPLEPFIEIRGVAHVLGPNELRVDDPNRGPIRISFDGRAAPGVAFPADLAGVDVIAVVLATDRIFAPDGRALPYPALALATTTGGTTRDRFILGEDDVPGEEGLAGIPRPLDELGADAPKFEVFSDLVQFDPSSCGIVYYDLLRVYYGSTGTVALRPGERATVQVLEGESSWTAANVMTFHREGCRSRAQAWAQLAAWRPGW